MICLKKIRSQKDRIDSDRRGQTALFFNTLTTRRGGKLPRCIRLSDTSEIEYIESYSGAIPTPLVNLTT